MEIEEGLSILTDTIKNDKRHQDYERVTDLAEEYFKMVSGKDICELLRRITRRETVDEFEMR